MDLPLHWWVWNEAKAGQPEFGFNSEYTHGKKWVGEQFIMVKTLKSFKMSFIKDLSLCQCHKTTKWLW